MAKKKKETCPYCGKSFAYLSRHKCKIKERVEGGVEDKTEAERIEVTSSLVSSAFSSPCRQLKVKQSNMTRGIIMSNFFICSLLAGFFVSPSGDSLTYNTKEILIQLREGRSWIGRDFEGE